VQAANEEGGCLNSDRARKPFDAFELGRKQLVWNKAVATIET
jgi:hypothetical protein